MSKMHHGQESHIDIYVVLYTNVIFPFRFCDHDETGAAARPIFAAGFCRGGLLAALLTCWRWLGARVRKKPEGEAEKVLLVG